MSSSRSCSLDLGLTSILEINFRKFRYLSGTSVEFASSSVAICSMKSCIPLTVTLVPRQSQSGD